jgi:hypothetical protein
MIKSFKIKGIVLVALTGVSFESLMANPQQPNQQRNPNSVAQKLTQAVKKVVNVVKSGPSTALSHGIISPVQKATQAIKNVVNGVKSGSVPAVYVGQDKFGMPKFGNPNHAPSNVVNGVKSGSVPAVYVGQDKFGMPKFGNPNRPASQGTPPKTGGILPAPPSQQGGRMMAPPPGVTYTSIPNSGPGGSQSIGSKIKNSIFQVRNKLNSGGAIQSILPLKGQSKGGKGTIEPFVMPAGANVRMMAPPPGVTYTSIPNSGPVAPQSIGSQIKNSIRGMKNNIFIIKSKSNSGATNDEVMASQPPRTGGVLPYWGSVQNTQ